MVTKAHDQTLPEAVHRLSSVLGQYMFMYNEAIESVHQNLQVQKTVYLDNIIKAIVSRILELKHELEKLEGSKFQFIGHGLTEVHHTVYDIEMTAIPLEIGRPEQIQTKLEHILARAKENKEAKEEIAEEPEEASQVLHQLWDSEENIKDKHDEKKEKVEKISEETRKTREYLAMILAHEKTRQVTRWVKVSKLRRDIWEKQLAGQLPPVARYEIRERSAKLIQTVFRAYFELKRERIKNCRRDLLLGLNICETPNNIDKERRNAEEMLRNRSRLHQKYKKEWLLQRKDLKEQFLRNNRARLNEEFRDQIRDWFMEWFESIQFFHEIPQAGSTVIFKGEVPGPREWLEENTALLLQKQANKKKSPQDLKIEKKEAKKQEQMLKKEEQMKLKVEAELLKKLMKNPTMHPGYNYPHSKRTDYLLEVIDHYHKSWDFYDVWETLDVKEKYVRSVDLEDVIMEAKLEVLPSVDEHMRLEFHKLKQALREDYKRNEEQMPIDLTKPIKREKIKKKVRADFSEHVAEQIENLAIHGFIVEYTKIKIEDFIGDPNFAGEDLRSQILPAFPFNFEIRAFWWERCREVCHGFHKILLVGPKTCGKTILVRALASVNDAVLFELDPYKVQGGSLSPTFLKRLLNDVVASARAVQPSVIHIKYIQKLFYTKIPPEEADMNLALIKTFFVQKLLKKIHKTDKITVIGTCTEPWLAKSSALLKQFPAVLLLPKNTYSLTVQMLKEWVIQHNIIPADFNVSNLAQVLQGYGFGYLKKTLDKFMSADRIVKIAAFGLTPMDVYNFILDDETENIAEYDKYLKWYSEKTASGKKEVQHLKEQINYKALAEKYAAKKKKKAQSAPSSTTVSNTSL